jgi:hypothetical protein
MEDNIKMYLKTRWDEADWIHLAQDRESGGFLRTW